MAKIERYLTNFLKNIRFKHGVWMLDYAAITPSPRFFSDEPIFLLRIKVEKDLLPWNFGVMLILHGTKLLE
jgi:hypothetical protein